MAKKVYLAVDLGAESGRVMAGIWNGRTLLLEEIHRFPNVVVSIGDTIRWDILRLWTEIQNGLTLAGKKFGKQVVSVGADTWGVDFVLLNKQNEMLGQPYHYRDARTHGAIERACKKVPRAEIFAQTGLQFMELNSLYQLLAWQKHSPATLEAADKLETVVSKKSGLLGVSELSNDMRDLREAINAGNAKAKLAVAKFTWTIARWIGSYVAELNGLDMLVFTGGIGENDINARAEICANLDALGIILDSKRNNVRGAAVISSEHSPVTVCVIPPAEDLMIVNHVVRLLGK